MKKLLLFLVVILLTTISYGQLTGTKNIPVDYATIAAAVTDLNTQGVGAGGVTFNVDAGHTETSSNILITTTTSSVANPIIFQRTGAGANPLITAAAGTSATLDGIIKIRGTDYVTFDGIDLLDPVSNATATTRMEWGFAILMTSATDASQNITIVNCNITLQKIYTASPYSSGIYSKNHTAAATTLITPTSAAGVVSNCQVDNCMISDVIYGINWTGSSTAAYYGLNNFFGYTTGNTITNFGGGATTPYGIYTIYQNNLKIANNNVTGGTGTTTTEYGIYTGTGTNANVEIFQNTVDLTSSATTSTAYGIYSTMGGSGTTNSVAIYYNLVTITFPTATSGGMYGIYHTASAWHCDIYGNTVMNCTLGNGTTTATGTFGGIYTSGSNTTTGSTWNIIQNTVSDNARVQSVRGSGTTYGIYNSSSGLTCSISENNVYNNSWPSSGTAYCMYISNSSATNLTIMSNSVYDNSKPGALTNVLPKSGALNGIYVSGSATSGLCTVESNSVYNLANTWGGQVLPFRCEGGATSAMKILSNRAFGISSEDNAIFGIYNATGLNVEVYGNRVYDFVSIGDSGSFYGICTGSTTAAATTSVYNNFISDLSAPEAAVYLSSGLYLFGSTGGTTHRYYDNTVYLNQVNTAGNPSSAACYANTGANLDMRNNILVNNATVFGTGATIAFWRSNITGTTYSANSNYNCLHAGTPGPANLLFYAFDAVTPQAAQDMATYQTIFPQEGQSFSEVPPFMNIAATPYNLRLNAAVATPCESGGSIIGTPDITTDYDGEPRFPNPGYPNNANPSYSATAPDVGADEFGGIPLFSCGTPDPGNTLASANNFCLGTGTTLSVQNPTAGTGVSFQWQSSVNGIDFTDIPGAVSSTYYTVPNAPLYFQCVVTCQNGPVSGTSVPVQILFTNSITSTTPGSRCGSGTVSLEATGSGGTTLKWYDAITGGVPLGTGSPFTTPAISTTTSFYVAAESYVPGFVSIGTGTNQNTSTTYPTPYGAYYESAKHQFLILASELLLAGVQAGNIDNIGFDVVSVGSSGIHTDFTIKMASTALTSMTTSFVTTGLTTVFGPVNYQPVLGINTHVFATSFVWDGTSNIIVETCHSNDPTGTGGTLYTNNAIVNRTTTAFTSVAYANNDNTDDCPLATGSSTSAIRPNMIFPGFANCSSARSEVVATVTAPPALTITGSQTICNNAIYQIDVTSTIADFDTYTWSPVDNLFTDAACTIPYVALTSATTVYVKSANAVITTYTCTANNLTSGCVSTTESTITTLPASPTLTADPESICSSGSSVLSILPATGWGTATFQWQDSPDNSTFTDIPGATNLSYTTTTLTTTTYFKVIIKNGAGVVCTELQVTILVSNPLVTGTTPGTRCGIGTVELQASGTGGILRWYEASTGGASIGTGSPFTTPIINATTSFYVGCLAFSPGAASVGAGASTMTSYPNPFYSAWSNIHTQHLITAAELEAAGIGAGNLTSVALDVTSAGTLPMIDFSLKIAATTATNMSAFLSPSFSTVYTNASLMPVVGLNVLTFSAPFYWDGVSSIVLEFCHGNAGSTATMSRTVKSDATSYVSSIKTHVAAATSAATICSDVTTNLLTYSSRPVFRFQGQVACSSPRTEVIATVTLPPALTISAGQAICVNEVYQIDVTSTLFDFDTYTWEPVTDLFTDAACTVPYVVLSSAATVYVKSATGGSTTYTCTGTKISSGCVNTAQTTIIVIPVPTISSNPESICITGSASLGILPASGYGDATFQWQDSPDNIVFNDITGATTMSYITPTISTTTFYKMVVRNGSGSICSETVYALIVNNPLVTGTTPGTRCGTGTVQLEATANGGSTLNWYGAGSGGNILGTGSPFTTPSISTTTSFWVAASSGGQSGLTIPGDGGWNHVGTGGAFQTSLITGAYMILTVLQPLTLNSMDIYPSATLGTAFSLEARTGSASGTTYASWSGTTTVVNSGTPTVAQTVPVNWILPAGVYYIGFVGTNPSTWRTSATHTFPWTLPGIASMDFYLTPSYQYYLYNLQLSTGCESSRTEVIATVTPPPAITPSADPLNVCAGSPSTLDVTSGNPGYSYTWMPGSLIGATQTVYPETTTTYTVTADDGSCITTGSATVTVLTTPSPITITPSAPVIGPGAIQQLTATGGEVPEMQIFSENFNGANSWTTVNNSTSGTPALAAWTLQPDGYIYSSVTYHSNDNSQFYMTNSDAQGSGGITATELISPVINTSGFSSLTLMFWHYFRYIDVDSQAKVEVSTDGGTTWDPTPAASYTTTLGSEAAFVQATVDLSAYINQSNLKIRFRYADTYGWYWCIDNVSLSGSALGNITWSPFTDLYSDAPATVPYAGENLATVYTKPAATITYTASSTATSTGCVRTKTVLVTVAQLPVVTTASVTNILATSATGGGEVTSDGGGTVSARGVCWSTSLNPTIADPKTSDGSGLGVFSSNISPLVAATSYHVRAYATNEVGTAYGADVPFTTASSIPEFLTLQNVTVTSTECFDATNTITVAGGGTYFIVSGSGFATFIAGVKISFMPGTAVQSPGHMIGKIYTGSWCGAKSPSFPAVVTGQEATTPFSIEQAFFSIYPNPTNGNFTLVQKGEKVYGTVKVEVFSMNGEKVMTDRMVGEKQHEFRSSDLPTGLYFVKVIADDYVETIKLVKTR